MTDLQRIRERIERLRVMADHYRNAGREDAAKRADARIAEVEQQLREATDD